MQTHAIDDLRFIRETMESAASFTAVPGWGVVMIGITALASAVIASLRPQVVWWVGVWGFEALCAFAVGASAIFWKARKVQTPLFSRPGRKFVLGLSPPMLAAAVLSMVIYRAGVFNLLPGVWLLLYGAGVVTAGAYSVKVVPIMGLCFMFAGIVSPVLPSCLGQFDHGGGFRRASHPLRDDYCEEVRWLDRIPMPQPELQGRANWCGRRNDCAGERRWARPPNWTV